MIRFQFQLLENSKLLEKQTTRKGLFSPGGWDNVGKAMHTSSPQACGLLIAHADLLSPLEGRDLPGGWLAVHRGFVKGVGKAGDEPAAHRVVDASGCLVTPGLVNAHHHMYQSLNRGLVVNRTFNGLVEWLNFHYPIWERLDEEGAYLSTWISLAGLALDGCTTSSDHLNIHPRKKLIDAEIAAAHDIGMRFHPARGAMNLSRK